jgi:hypothetical protein
LLYKKAFLKNYSKEMNRHHRINQILKEIDKFTRMTVDLEDQVIARQFAYIKAEVDTGLYTDSLPMSERHYKASLDAYNLVDGYSFRDICHFHVGDSLIKSPGSRSDALISLKNRLDEVKRLIKENFLN